MTDYTARLPTRDPRQTWYGLVRDGYLVTTSQRREDVVDQARYTASREPHSVIRAVAFKAHPDENPRDAANRARVTDDDYPAFWEHWGEPTEPSATESRGSAAASNSSSSTTGWVVAVLIAVVVATLLAWALMNHSGGSSKPSPSTSSASSSSSTSSESPSTSTVTSTESPSTITQTQTQTETSSSSSTEKPSSSSVSSGSSQG